MSEYGGARAYSDRGAGWESEYTVKHVSMPGGLLLLYFTISGLDIAGISVIAGGAIYCHILTIEFDKYREVIF